MNADAFRARLAATRRRWVALLERMTNIASGSEMTDGVAEVGRLVAAELRELGFTVREVGGGPFAPHLLAQRGPADRPIVLGGHLDTTYTDYAPLPRFRVEGPRAVGPGTSDMRGGVVVILAALDCLRAAGLLDGRSLAVLLNSDEERGAASSRELLRDFATRARAALFAECGGEEGQIIISRRAKLSYALNVTGVGRHAGEKSGPKASALVDLAHRILAIEQLNGRFEDTAFNVGRAFGGVASNTVPPTATALIDIRFPRAEQEAPIRQALADAAAARHVPGCSASLTLTSFRPPWPASGAGLALARRVCQAAAALGRKIEPVPRGGTSDANWFGAAGVPTVDGLGPIGYEEHTPEEYILLETLFDRARLLATVLADLPQEGAP